MNPDGTQDFDPAQAAQEQQRRAQQQQMLSGALSAQPGQPSQFYGAPQPSGQAPQQDMPQVAMPGSPQIFPIAQPIQTSGGLSGMLGGGSGGGGMAGMAAMFA